MKSVSFGKADAALGELAVLHHLMAAHMLSDLTVSGEAIMGDLVYSLLNIATRKDLPILASILSKGLESISIEEKRALRMKWLDRPGAVLSDGNLLESEKRFIKEHPVVRFRTRSSVPPFEFYEGGQAKGIAVDYIRRICEELGIEPEFVIDDRPLDEAFKEIEGDRTDFDTILYTVKNASREERFSFGDAYLAYPSVVITRKDGVFVGAMADLANKKVAIEKGYLTNKWLARDHPEIEVLQVDHTIDALKMVNDKQVDAYVGNMAVANYMINRRGMDELKIAAPSGYDTVSFSFIGPREWPELPSLMSKGLHSIPADEHSRLQQKWFSLQIVEKFDYEKLLYTVIVFIVVVTLLLYRQNSIRKMNDKLELSYKEIEEKNKLLEELAVTDNLTKLYNRNKLDEVLVTESNRSNRYASIFGVIMIDIDNFKRVNDVHGHQIGDKILQEFAEILRANSRKSDIVGRWGGEEFLIVCCETSVAGTVAFAENLREVIASYPFTLGEQKTASLGVSLFQRGEDVTALLKRADNALYKAKENGRNRVEIL
jgi:polar amino acid transport system substrate-binding protein